MYVYLWAHKWGNVCVKSGLLGQSCYKVLLEDCHVKQTTGLAKTSCAFKDDTPEEAAKTFNELNFRLQKLVDYLYRKYNTDDGSHAARIKDQLRQLTINYSPKAIHEVDPHNISGDTSYVEGKGRIIGICLRDPKTLRIHDINTLTFVFLHEATHLSIKAIQHPPEFWSAFGALLKEAIDAKIYTYVDYYKYPVNYCGMTIQTTPLRL